ncbi:MAG TPA: class III extradiol ring-cleavage dioxygenase [Lautropia sp.]|jgi:aromatic ring-opening dioxygenase catalytic subunit (LigB family)|nr:class III extradiol ring-cleavage dioxygenase [Lautropia sp.]
MDELPTTVPARQPAIFLPHGGGPCFFMHWPPDADPWAELGDFLRNLASSLPERPKAILIVSGHWEEQAFAVNTGESPPLLYDYYGFPEHTYHLDYAAPGAPALAHQVRKLLRDAGLSSQEDDARGFDHGVFVPLLLVDPEAAIPVLQVSLQRSLDPALHLAAGRALATLREEGVLIVGSGMSFHNMRGFGGGFEAASERFDEWLSQVVTDPDPQRRDTALTHWQQAPDARTCHPREEHLMPLMVVAGAAAGDPGRTIFKGRIPNVTVSAFRFG